MAKRVLILSASVGSGHGTAGAALERAFRDIPGVEADHKDALALASGLLRTTYGRDPDGNYFELQEIFPTDHALSFERLSEPRKG